MRADSTTRYRLHLRRHVTSARWHSYGTVITHRLQRILDSPMPLQVFTMRTGVYKTYPHMAVQWAWAFDTPFKWTNRWLSHSGVTGKVWLFRGPATPTTLVASRTPFHHVIDIGPNHLQSIRPERAPEVVDGSRQKPIEGVSMAYTFDEANSMHRQAAKRSIRVGRHRGIYHDRVDGQHGLRPLRSGTWHGPSCPPRHRLPVGV